MDPEACLNRAADHAADGEWEDAFYALRYLRDWHQNAGYADCGRAFRLSVLVLEALAEKLEWT